MGATDAVAESVNAGCSVREHVERLVREAGVVQVVAAAALARISDRVAHARLVALCLAERKARPVPAPALLQTLGAIRLRGRRRALGRRS